MITTINNLYILYKNNKKNNIKYQNKTITTYDFFVNMQYLLLKRGNYFFKCNIKDSIKNIMLINNNNHTPSIIIKLLEKKPYYDELTEILYWYDNKVYDKKK